MEYYLVALIYILACLIISVDYVRYVIVTVPVVNRFDFEDLRNTLVLLVCQLLARLLLIFAAGKAIL